MTKYKNKKGGRPPLDEWSRRTHIVKTSLSDLEYENFKHDLKKSGLKSAELLRKLIIHIDLKEALSPEEKKCIREIYKHGQLLNIFFKNTPRSYQEAYQLAHQDALAAINKITDYFNSKL